MRIEETRQKPTFIISVRRTLESRRMRQIARLFFGIRWPMIAFNS